MPLSIIVYDDAANKKGSEAIAQGDGPARGRELEIAEILRFIKTAPIQNTVWLTADVHYAAAHYYDPNKAQFQDFEPFWEFVSGPLHAGTFGPNELDNTFGPRCGSSRRRAWTSRTCRRRPACSSSVTSRSTAASAR
jgi:alkaline phosphatase D